MVDPYKSRESRVTFASAIKIKLEKSLIDGRKGGYKEQGEGLYPGEIFQRAIVPVQTSNQIHNQLIVAEAPKKTQK